MPNTSGSRERNRRPPNGRGPMIFVMSKALVFLIFFSSIASLAINCKQNFTRNTAKTRLKMTFTSTYNTFTDFQPSPPVDKVHVP